MLYHVGRVCAVASYTDLYHKLDILPDVPIAKEACDNAEGRCKIFAEITHPCPICNHSDYTRAVNVVNSQGGVYMNSNASVQSIFKVTQPVEDLADRSVSLSECHFDREKSMPNITPTQSYRLVRLVNSIRCECYKSIALMLQAE